jgi:hypothetical protein
MGAGQSIAPTRQFGTRAEAPTFLISLAISSQRLEVGPDHGCAAAALSLSGNFAGRGFWLTERFQEFLDRHRQAELVALYKAIRDGLGDPKDLYRRTLNTMSFEAFIEQAFSETDDANGSPVRFRVPEIPTYSSRTCFGS